MLNTDSNGYISGSGLTRMRLSDNRNVMTPPLPSDLSPEDFKARLDIWLNDKQVNDSLKTIYKDLYNLLEKLVSFINSNPEIININYKGQKNEVDLESGVFKIQPVKHN